MWLNFQRWCDYSSIFLVWKRVYYRPVFLDWQSYRRMESLKQNGTVWTPFCKIVGFRSIKTMKKHFWILIKGYHP